MKLRVLSTVLAATLACTGAIAGNDGNGLPAMDTSKSDHTVEIGIHAGDGVTSIRQNYTKAIPSLTDFDLTAGNDFVVGASAVIPVRNHLGIGTRIEFAASNYRWSMTMVDRANSTLSVVNCRNHFYTIDLPAYIQLRFNVGTRVNWRTEIGAYLSLGMGGNSKIKETASSTNSLGQSQVAVQYFKDKYFEDSNPVVNGINNTDWGLHIATGFVIDRHWSLNWTLRAGARDIAKNMGVLDISIHSLSAFFSVGYIF